MRLGLSQCMSSSNKEPHIIHSVHEIFIPWFVKLLVNHLLNQGRLTTRGNGYKSFDLKSESDFRYVQQKRGKMNF